MTSKENIEKARNAIGKSGFRGVRASGHDKKPWTATVGFQGREIYCGIFETAIEAAIAYDEKAVEILGRGAITNEMLGLLNNEDLDYEQRLLPISVQFCKYLEHRKSRTGKFIEFSKAELKKALPIADVAKILNRLESEGFILIQNKSQLPQLATVKFIYKVIRQFQENIEQTKQQEKQAMATTQEIALKSPAELEALAKQLMEMSEIKKKEIASGDQIRKTLNPLILNICQAKGKYDRILEQMLDTSTELDNAVKALKQALSNVCQ